ncbi:MAG: HNH endonuclease [Actinomycetota bacterium]
MIRAGGRGSRHLRAHRVAWELIHGPIPAGRLICHHCDNPPCVNPRHLFLGTAHSNALDRKRKDRGVRTVGHGKLTPESVQEIRRRYAAEPHVVGALGHGVTASLDQLAQEYGVHPSTVWRVVQRINWRHVCSEPRSTLEG